MLQSMGLQRAGQDLRTEQQFYIYIYIYNAEQTKESCRMICTVYDHLYKI